MRHIAMAAVLALDIAGMPGLAHAALHGNGKKVTQARPLVAPFTEIRLEGPIDIKVSEGDTPEMSVTIDENLQAAVTTALEGTTLVIGTKESLDVSGEARVNVRLPRLLGLALIGSGDAEVTCGSAARPLRVELKGSGDLTLACTATRLEVESNGSGDIHIKATADEAKVVGRGSGDLAYSGDSKRLEIELGGSGDAELSGTCEALKASLRGSGDVLARGLAAKNAEVATSGSGDIKLTLAGGSLIADSRGSGDIDWWGAGRVEHAETDGSGEIRHR